MCHNRSENWRSKIYGLLTTKLYKMTKAKIKKEINKRYSDTIAYKNLPKAYQFGMKMFKEEVVNFISSNFYVIKSLPSDAEISKLKNASHRAGAMWLKEEIMKRGNVL